MRLFLAGSSFCDALQIGLKPLIEDLNFIEEILSASEENDNVNDEQNSSVSSSVYCSSRRFSLISWKSPSHISPPLSVVASTLHIESESERESRFTLGFTHW